MFNTDISFHKNVKISLIHTGYSCHSDEGNTWNVKILNLQYKKIVVKKCIRIIFRIFAHEFKPILL